MTATEVITVLTALTTLVTAIGVAIVAVRQAGVKKAVTETHNLVNSRMDGMMRLLQDYRGAMQLGGVAIPGDESIPVKQKEQKEHP